LEDESGCTSESQQFPKWVNGPDGPEIVPNAEVERLRLGLAGLWEAERAKPIEQRQWFRLADLADKLARDPHTLTSDSALRGRIVEELVAWCRRTLAAGEIAILSGDPPSFELLTSLPTYPRDPIEGLRLRREFVRRFLEAYISLPGVERLRRRLAGDGAALDGPAAETRQPPSLTLEKSLWDWASLIARDHGENFTRVCASLLGDVIGGMLVTSPPLAEGGRQFLRDIDAVGKLQAGGPRCWRPDDQNQPGFWLARLIVAKAEIDCWLSAHGAAAAPGSGSAGTMAAAAAAAGGHAPRRGPKPEKRLRVEAAIRAQITNGERTIDEVVALKEVSLALEYDVSRDTARKARSNVLSEFQPPKPRQIPTIDK